MHCTIDGDCCLLVCAICLLHMFVMAWISRYASLLEEISPRVNLYQHFHKTLKGGGGGGPGKDYFLDHPY